MLAGLLAHCGSTGTVTGWSPPSAPSAKHLGDPFWRSADVWPSSRTRPWKWLTKHVPVAHRGVLVSMLTSVSVYPLNAATLRRPGYRVRQSPGQPRDQSALVRMAGISGGVGRELCAASCEDQESAQGQPLRGCHDEPNGCRPWKPSARSNDLEGRHGCGDSRGETCEGLPAKRSATHCAIVTPPTICV